MKPLISVLISDEKNTKMKPTWVPLPMTKDPDVILSVCDRLGMGGDFNRDEDHEIILAYRSALGFKIEADTPSWYVQYTAECLNHFKPEQLEYLCKLCHDYDLTHEQIQPVIDGVYKANGIEKPDCYKYL